MKASTAALLLICLCVSAPASADREILYRGEPVSFWIDALDDTDREVRLAAATEIGRMFPHSVAPYVIDVVEHLDRETDSDVRKLLAKALPHVAAGVASLRDDPETRRIYKRDLGWVPRVPDPTRWVDSLGSLLEHPDPEVRGAACTTLGSLGGERARPAVPGLAERLSDTHASVRLAAAGALDDLGPAALAAAPALEQTLGDPETKVRVAAAFALISIGPPHDEAAFPVLLAAPPQTQQLLERIASAGARAVPTLVALARKKPLWRPADHAFGPVRRQYPEAYDAILARLREMVWEGSDQERRDALFFLGQIAPDGVPHLVEALDHAESDVRLLAVVQLWIFGRHAEAAPPGLARLLEDPDSLVRRKAAFALEEMDFAPEILPALVGAIGDPDGDVRRAVVSTLGRGGELAHEAAPTILEALDDEDLAVRQAAVRALGEIGASPEVVVPVLAPLLDDPVRGVRLNAAYALLGIGQGQALAGDLIPLWLEAAEAGDERGRRRAAEALIEVGSDDPRVIRWFLGGSGGKPARRARKDLQRRLESVPLPLLREVLRADCPDPCVHAIGLELASRASEAVPALPELLDAYRASDVHPINGRSFSRHVAKLGPEAIPTLRAALDDESAAVRRLAEETLARIEGTSVQPPARSANRSAEIAERRRTAFPVDERGLREVDELRDRGNAGFGGFVRLLGHPDRGVRYKAAAALRPHEALLEPFVPDLLATFLRQPENQQVRGVLVALIDAVEITPPLLERFVTWTRHADADVRVGAVRFLFETGPRAAPAAAALRDALSDPEPEVRAWAASALPRIGPAGADGVGDLARVLHDAEPRPRKAACAALEALGGVAVGAMAELRWALSDGPSDIHRCAVRVLASFGAAARPASPELRARLADEDPITRLLAAKTLAESGVATPEVLAVLRSALEGEHPPRVGEAIDALALLGPAAAPAAPRLLELGAVRTLGAIGPSARPLVRLGMSDPSSGIEQTAREVHRHLEQRPRP